MSEARFIRQIGDQRLVVVCDAPQEPLACDVLETIAAIAARDAPRPGMRIRFGWSLLTLQREDDGVLVVCEPDFNSDPLKDVRPIMTTTLDVLAQQSTLLATVGVSPVDVTFDQWLIVRRGALECEALQLFRVAPEHDEDSGWRIVSTDLPGSRADDFKSMRVYELLSTRRGAMAALSLPENVTVAMSGDVITDVIDEEGRNLIRGVR